LNAAIFSKIEQYIEDELAVNHVAAPRESPTLESIRAFFYYETDHGGRKAFLIWKDKDGASIVVEKINPNNKVELDNFLEDKNLPTSEGAKLASKVAQEFGDYAVDLFNLAYNGHWKNLFKIHYPAVDELYRDATIIDASSGKLGVPIAAIGYDEETKEYPLYLNYRGILLVACREYILRRKVFPYFKDAYLYVAGFTIVHEIGHRIWGDVDLLRSRYKDIPHEEANILQDHFINLDIASGLYKLVRRGKGTYVPLGFCGKEVSFTGAWNSKVDGASARKIMEIFRKYYSLTSLTANLEVEDRAKGDAGIVAGNPVFVKVEFPESLTPEFTSSSNFVLFLHRFLHEVLDKRKLLSKSKDEEPQVPPPPPKTEFEVGDKVRVRSTREIGWVKSVNPNTGEIVVDTEPPQMF